MFLFTTTSYNLVLTIRSTFFNLKKQKSECILAQTIHKPISTKYTNTTFGTPKKGEFKQLLLRSNRLLVFDSKKVVKNS